MTSECRPEGQVTNTMPRPIAITIIAVLTLPVKLLVLFSPDLYDTLSELMPAASDAGFLVIPLPLQLAHGLIGSLVWIVAGLALWKGLNWGRWLAIFWGATVLLVTLAVAGLGLSLLLKATTFAVLCFFLTNRRAAGYFGAGEGEAAP